METKLPYDSIPSYPECYTPATVVARMLDGLAFRYRWATEGLGPKDADNRMSPDARSVLELLQHIYGLSMVILNTAKKTANDRTRPLEVPSTISLLRTQTLENLVTARRLLGASQDLARHPIQYRTSDGLVEYPFWIQINGPIEDAVWHSGQIAMLRRASGNPMPAGVDVFMGITKK